MDHVTPYPVETGWTEALNRLQQQGQLRSLRPLLQRGKYVATTDRPEHWMLNLSGNDYLGLAAQKDEFERFMHADFAEFRMSASSSRLLTGNDPVCERLEEEIARCYGKSALLFNSGYHANTGILPALCDARTLVLADKWVHASMVDGMRLSTATVHRFRHNDLGHLNRLLEKYAASYSVIFLLTESVFSMDGDTAPLLDFIDLKKKYPNLLLYVDEAHALGVRGARGLGYVEELDCVAEVDILVGTFGKALASMGAFVACSEVMKQVLINRSRSLIFSTQLPPMQAAWTLHLWLKMQSMHAERARLIALAERLTQGRTQSHIVPCIVGESQETVRLAEQLQVLGYYVLPIRPPTVPQGTSRLRLSLRADMEIEEMDSLRTLLKTHLNDCL